MTDPIEAAARLTEDLSALDSSVEAIALRSSKNRHVGSVLVDDIWAIIKRIAEIGPVSLEWSPRSTQDDTAYPTKQDAFRAVAEHPGCDAEDDDVVWRYIGRWHEGSEAPDGASNEPAPSEVI